MVEIAQVVWWEKLWGAAFDEGPHCIQWMKHLVKALCKRCFGDRWDCTHEHVEVSQELINCLANTDFNFENTLVLCNVPPWGYSMMILILILIRCSDNYSTIPLFRLFQWCVLSWSSRWLTLQYQVQIPRCLHFEVLCYVSAALLHYGGTKVAYRSCWSCTHIIIFTVHCMVIVNIRL